MAVYLHKNPFIDLTINSNTKPYNSASSRLWVWAPFHCSYRGNFCNCEKKAWKKNQACARNEPMASAIPVQRSNQYEWWYPTNTRERKVSTPSTSKEQKTNSHVNSHVTSIWNIRGMSLTQLSSNPEYIKVPSSRHYLTTDSGRLLPI